MAIKFSTHTERLDKTKEIIDAGKEVMTAYTPAYMDAVFTKWYLSGKIAAAVLVRSLPDPVDYGIALSRPSTHTVGLWIRTKFQERAEELDEEYNQRFKENLIAEKVQMLQAHAEAAAELQRVGFSFFKEHPEKITALVALRLVVEGIRIERESVGIPRTLEKLGEKSDEDLVKQIEEMIQHSPTNFLPLMDQVEEDITDDAV